MELVELCDDVSQTEFGKAWRVIAQACDFIDEQLHKGGCVLVHCDDGAIRAAAVISAAIMRQRHCTFVVALQALKAVWPRACLSNAYELLMEEWEQEVLMGRSPGTPQVDAWTIIRADTPPTSPAPGSLITQGGSHPKTAKERVAAALVLRYRQAAGVSTPEVLLVRREDAKLAELEATVPEGPVHHGESAQQAALRVCRSWTGLSSQVIMCAELAPNLFLVPRQPLQPQTTELQQLVQCFVFIAKPPEDLTFATGKSLAEHHRWVSAAEVEAGTALVAANWRNTILEALTVLKTGQLPSATTEALQVACNETTGPSWWALWAAHVDDQAVDDDIEGDICNSPSPVPSQAEADSKEHKVATTGLGVAIVGSPLHDLYHKQRLSRHA